MSLLSFSYILKGQERVVTNKVKINDNKGPRDRGTNAFPGIAEIQKFRNLKLSFGVEGS